MIRAFKGSYPVSRRFGVVDSAYKNYPGSRHPGTDYPLPVNTPLYAGIAGTVTVIYRSTYVGRGNEVIITNGNIVRKYCHMNRIDVKNGQKVTEGQLVGLSGNTGYVLPRPTASNPNAGAHLHDELLIDGTYIDLEQYLKGGSMAILTKEEVKLTYMIAYRVNEASVNQSVVSAFTGKTNQELLQFIWQDPTFQKLKAGKTANYQPVTEQLYKKV